MLPVNMPSPPTCQMQMKGLEELERTELEKSLTTLRGGDNAQVDGCLQDGSWHSCRSRNLVRDSTNLTDTFHTQWYRLLTSSTYTIYRCANLGCAKIKILLKFDPIKNRSWGFIRRIERNVFPRGIKKQMKLEGGKKFGQK
jgi:hypothetical protein